MKSDRSPTRWRKTHNVQVTKAPMKRLDTFREITGIAQSIAITLSIIAAGGWALTRFSVLLEARIATAQLEKAEAETVTAKRNARTESVVVADISAFQLPSTSGKKDIVVELNLRNTGNAPAKVDLSADTRFYLAKLGGVDGQGKQSYDDIYTLQFDYPDKTLTWFYLQPGAELSKYRTVQRVKDSGTYLVRFSATTDDKSVPTQSEYGAQFFITVK